MAASSYPSPVDKLLTYGDISEMQEVPNYVEELGFSARANASCQQEPLNVNKAQNNRINARLLTIF